jgi:hypothetical protein
MGLKPSHVTFTQVPDSGSNNARDQVTISGVAMFTWIPGISGKYTSPPIIATMPVQSRGATN